MQLKNNKVNLCDSCIHTYPDCPAFGDDVVFGDGVGNDNICACSKYEHIRIDADAISRQAAVSRSRWIPVTERLPEDNTEVWVTTEMLSEVTRACWHKDSNLWCHPYYSNCLLVLRPIAWMEMSFPEPYKG